MTLLTQIYEKILSCNEKNKKKKKKIIKEKQKWKLINFLFIFI